MTNHEILTKAINKAIDGGWDVYASIEAPIDSTQWYVSETLMLVLLYSPGGGTAKGLEEAIFNQEFAKALWGEKQYGVDYKDLNGDDFYYEGSAEGLGMEAPAYLFHLQQMVIADDPVKYLEEHM